MHSHVCHPCIHSHMRRESSLRVTPIMPVPLLRALALVDKTPTTHLAVTHQVAPCTYTCTIHMHDAHTHAPCTTLGMLHAIVQFMHTTCLAALFDRMRGSCTGFPRPSVGQTAPQKTAHSGHSEPTRGRVPVRRRLRFIWGSHTHTLYCWCICVM